MKNFKFGWNFSGIFLALLTLGVFYLGGSARAQQDPAIATGIQISPIRFDWEMNSGEEITGTVNVKNYSDKKYNIDLHAEDFFVSDDSNEAQFFVPGREHSRYAYDVINWITMPGEIALAPKEGRNISFTVKVPPKTPTGGYYGIIFFLAKAEGSAAEDSSENSKIIVYPQMGALLTLAVKGAEPIRQAAELKDFSVAKRIFWQSLVDLSGEIFNSGNIHFKGTGHIQIEKFGKKIKEFDLIPQIMYPEKNRKYESSWNFSTWTLGRYAATFNFESEDHAIQLSKTISFWVLSWKAVAIFFVVFLALLGFLLIIFILYRSRGKLKKVLDILRNKE